MKDERLCIIPSAGLLRCSPTSSRLFACYVSRVLLETIPRSCLTRRHSNASKLFPSSPLFVRKAWCSFRCRWRLVTPSVPIDRRQILPYRFFIAGRRIVKSTSWRWWLRRLASERVWPTREARMSRCGRCMWCLCLLVRRYVQRMHGWLEFLPVSSHRSLQQRFRRCDARVDFDWQPQWKYH